MQISSALGRIASALVLAVISSSLCFAVDTHIWEQSDQSDFARGTTKNISIRSDGHLMLAPEFKELDSTPVPYLWALAQDSKGTLYYAGGGPTGATTKIFARSTDGKCKVIAELPGLEIQALAVDSSDRLYAAVLPDAKIYRIDKSGKSEVFFNPKCKYVWAMAFDHAGNLFAATGDSGLIYKIAPDGKGVEFAKTEEAHARSMIIDATGNLIVGTEPGGLIVRINPEGKGFVLYQAAKREVTAVAEHDGIIYAAAVGNKPVSVTGLPPILPTNTAPVNAVGVARAGAPVPTAVPSVGALSAAVSGGSEVYRIEKDGAAQKIWESPTDLVYAIAFDPAGKPVLGTGNKGIIYRVDSDQLSTQLIEAPPTQVTAFLQGKSGVIYAATGNVGNVYSIGPGLSKTGSLESDVLDSNDFSYWGKAHITSIGKSAGALKLEARSGNLNDPQHDWSGWSPVPVTELGGQIEAPPARFLQYRLTLTEQASGGNPEVSVVDIPFLPKNVAPKVHQIDIAPYNYRESPSSSSLERTVMASGSPASISVPAVGQRRAANASTTLDAAGAATLQYSKGFLTARWSASDANGDPLEFKVELRGKSDSVWRLLKDKLTDRYYALDTAAFADGNYYLRVTASDGPGNPPGEALTSALESDSFVIDNTPPSIENVRVENAGGKRIVRFTAKDAGSWIDKAEYSVNGADWVMLDPVNKVTDSQSLDYQLTVDGGSVLSVRVFDENDNQAVKQIF
jgi:hypothetical protein